MFYLQMIEKGADKIYSGVQISHHEKIVTLGSLYWTTIT